MGKPIARIAGSRSAPRRAQFPLLRRLPGSRLVGRAHPMPGHHTYTRYEPKGRRRRDLAVELPAHARVVEGRAGAGVRQHGRARSPPSSRRRRPPCSARSPPRCCPPGVLNVVHGFGPHAAGELLVGDPRVDLITFTGETRTGQAIMAAAAPDAEGRLAGDGRQVAEHRLRRRRPRQGGRRHDPRHLRQPGRGLPGGQPAVRRAPDPRRVHGAPGRRRARRCGSAIRSTRRRGRPARRARSIATRSSRTSQLARRRRRRRSSPAAGVPATRSCRRLLPRADDRHGRAAGAAPAQEEIFGPVLVAAPFDTEEEVVGLANGTEYGLARMVWTAEPLARAPRLGRAATRAWSGSTASSCATCARRSAARSDRASGARAATFSREFFTEPKAITIKIDGLDGIAPSARRGSKEA